ARRALHEIRAHPDLAGVFDGGEDVVWRRHEVPFSIQRDDRTIVRGTIDCLVKRASGLIQVLEFKTGRPLDAHRAQLALYVDAAKALFPGTPVEGRLLYAGE